MDTFGDKIISKHKAKKQKKKSRNGKLTATQCGEASLLKEQCRLSKKRKRKSIEKASNLKRLQLIIDSSSSESVTTLTPSKSEYQIISTKKPKGTVHKNIMSQKSETLLDDKPRKFNIRRFFRNYCGTLLYNDESESCLEELLSKTHISENVEEVHTDSETAIFQNESDFQESPSSHNHEEAHACSDIKEQTSTGLSAEGDDSSIVVEISDEEALQMEEESHSLNLSSSVLEVNKVKYIDLADSKLIILSGNTKISIHGIVSVTVLHGKIEVLGCIVDKTSEKVDIYSPRGLSLLYMRNIGDYEDETEATSCLKKFDIDVDKLDVFPPTSVVHCTKLQEPFMAYIEKHIPQQILPKKMSNSLQCVFDPASCESKGLINIVNTSDQWDEHIDIIMPNTKMMICGGKGVGKSTFLRYAINKLLQRFDKICVIDLDPGQSEFTVPGCISLITVKQPLLGPNYTHLQKTDCSVLSDIDVGANPKRYINRVKVLLSKYRPLVGAPTLINYMGFHRGLGLKITSAAIAIVRPTDVLMIQSQKSKNNFDRILSQPVVEEEAKLFLGKVNVCPYNVIIIRSLTDSNHGWSLVPRQIREMCFFAYFGKNEESIYEINISDIKLVDRRGKNVSPVAVDSNAVTLCSTLCDGEFLVLGWGIVRAVDEEDEVLYIQTPEEICVLDDVQYLVVGNVQLPPSYRMMANESGSATYIHAGEKQMTTRRCYLPVDKK